MVQVIYPEQTSANAPNDDNKIHIGPAISEVHAAAAQCVTLPPIVREFASGCAHHSDSNLDDSDDNRLAEIERIFDHQQMPLLKKFELAKEYVAIIEAQVSRHDVAKSAGRPEGGISLAARKLPIPGRTEAGRKKWLERALKIANLSPAVKAEAQKKGLARFQSKLLEVADIDGEAAQLQKVQEIAAGRGQKAKSEQAKADDGFQRALVRYPADCKDEFLRKLTELVDQFGAKLDA